MQNEIFLNPLSVDRQCHTPKDAEDAINLIVRCFNYILTAIKRQNVKIFYDDTIETRPLRRSGSNLKSDIDMLKNRDLRRQWYIYTRNHAQYAELDLCLVKVSCDNRELIGVEGAVRQDLIRSDARWLSFGGVALFNQSKLIVHREDSELPISITNAFDFCGFRDWWPRYAASSKHGTSGYYRPGGVWVSPMQLADGTAQEALLISISVGNLRYAFYQGEYLEFRRTYPDREIFHGFSVSREDIHPSLRKLIEP